MNHPTEEQLNAWIDGEADAVLRADDTAAHVEQCASCQQRVEGTRSLGAALRVWAVDAAPAPADDLFERIMAEAGAGGAAPEAHGGAGERAAATTKSPAAAEKPSESSDAKRAPGAGTGTVTPIGRHRRWSPAWAAAPVVLAAAAAAVFAITRPPTGVTTPEGTGNTVAVGGPSTGSGTGTGTGTGTGGGVGGTRVASADPGGSEVLAVDVGGAHTSYSVLEVAGSREGSTTAVVWIEDSSGPGAGAVQ